MSLRLRLTLWYSGILAAALLLVSVIVYFTLSYILIQQVDQFLNVRSQQYVRPLISAGDGRGADFLRSQIANFNPDTYAQFVLADGSPLGHTSNLPAGWTINMSMVSRALASGNAVSYTVHLGEAYVRINDYPVAFNGQPVGVLQLGRDVTQVEASLLGLREVLIGAGLGGVLVAFIAGWFIARQALRPIGRIAQTAEDIGHSRDFGRRVAYQGPNDELGRMCAAFNDMLSHIQAAYRQLESALASQRRFVADASHELRTPLTTIRGNIGLLASEPNVTREDRREALEDMGSEAERMSRLVANLLVLARADAGLHVEKRPVQVDDIMQDVYRQARVLSDGVRLCVEGPQPAAVEGSPDYLKQLLLILVDNALKNTPSGGEVSISDPIEDGFVRLTVRDTGMGIAAEALPHIFERFYQADKSRTGGGTGLGLAIAKWIAEEHGGRIQAESQPGRGSTFTVWLPRLSGIPSDPAPAPNELGGALG